MCTILFIDETANYTPFNYLLSPPHKGHYISDCQDKEWNFAALESIWTPDDVLCIKAISQNPYF